MGGSIGWTLDRHVNVKGSILARTWFFFFFFFLKYLFIFHNETSATERRVSEKAFHKDRDRDRERKKEKAQKSEVEVWN